MSLLTAIYRMVLRGSDHHGLGADHFIIRSPTIEAERPVAQLGFQVEPQPPAEAA